MPGQLAHEFRRARQSHEQDAEMNESQQFLIYQSEDSSTRIVVMLEAETLWQKQEQLTELFGKAKGTISEHIKHISEDGELDENSVVRRFRTTAANELKMARLH